MHKIDTFIVVDFFLVYISQEISFLTTYRIFYVKKTVCT
jgi:hypothetical protein